MINGASMNTKFRSFLEHKFSCLWDKDARVWLLTHVASTCLALWETANYLPEWLHYFTSLPALHERPSLSTFFPSWGIITDLKKFFFAALIDNKCAARHHIFNMKTCVSVLSHFSHVWHFATPGTVARQAPLSMGFSRQEYWSGLPFPPSGDLPDPGIKPPVSCTGRRVLYH